MVPQGVPKLTKWFPGSYNGGNRPPNDRFWTPKIAKFVSKVTAVTGKTIKNTLQKPTCFHTFHRKTKHSKQPTTSKLSKADELAQHSHHHAALFPRVGAGGRGRSP